MNQNKSIIPKRWTYELPYEILNDLSLKKLRNLKEIPEKLSIDGKSAAGTEEPNLNGCARNCAKILLNYVNLSS